MLRPRFHCPTASQATVRDERKRGGRTVSGKAMRNERTGFRDANGLMIGWQLVDDC